MVFVKCYYPPACLGAPNHALQGQYYYGTDSTVAAGGGTDLAMVLDDTNYTGASSCSFALGFRNTSRLCHACRGGFSRSAARAQCTLCEDGVGAASILLLLGTLAVFLGFAALVGMKLRSFGTGKFDNQRHRKAIHATLKRIILSHVQTFSLVLSLAVPWPKLMLDFLAVLSTVSAISENANVIECLMEGEMNHAQAYYSLLVAVAALPLVFLCILGLYWRLLAPCAVRCACGVQVITCGTKMKRGPLCLPAVVPVATETNSDGDDGHFTPSYADMFAASITLCWYLMLPSLMRIGFGVFQCRGIGDPSVEYLVIDMQEVCWEGRHMAFALGAGLPMLLLYAGLVPLGIMLRLHIAGPSRLTNPNLLLRYGLIHSGYRPEKYWFELVVLIRKYIVVAASTLILSEANQLQVVLAIIMIALHVHDANNPFGRTSPGEQLLHRYEMLSLLLLTFLVWSGLYFTSLSHLCETTQKGWCMLLVISVLILNVGYMLLVTLNFCTEWSKRSCLGSMLLRPFRRQRQRQHGGKEVEISVGSEQAGKAHDVAPGSCSVGIRMAGKSDDDNLSEMAELPEASDSDRPDMGNNPLFRKSEKPALGQTEIPMSDDWEQIYDENSGSYYWYNKETGESQW